MFLPKISIIVPSFNKADFIEDTLESLVLQNYPNLEVIIQDGGSTDGTLEIIKKYAQSYPKIFKYESKKDNGQLDAINKGLKKATGDILSFINADDVYEKGAFKKLSQAYIKNPNALWFAGKGRVINKNGKEIAKIATFYKSLFLFLNKKILALILNYFFQPSVFITRKAYLKYGPFTGTKTAVLEYDLWLKLFSVAKPFVIPETLSSFRLYKGSISTSKVKEMMGEDEKIAKKYTKNPIILFLHKLHNLARLLWA
jgi:glycosyltransferase involved in cell wall biosynthesis